MIERVHLGLLAVYRRLPTRARVAVVHAIAPGFTVGAMCVVARDDGHVLLVRHSYRHRWGVPGGLLRRGEEPRVAAVRECYEEVGLRISAVGEPAVVVDPRPRRVDIVFAARPVAAGPHTVEARSPEIVEVAWFPPDGLPELQAETAGAFEALGRRQAT